MRLFFSVLKHQKRTCFFVSQMALGALPACSLRLPIQSLPHSSVQEAWTPQNAPSSLGVNLQTQFFSLPLEGQTGTTPWADSYWPSNTAGISYRWNDPSVATSAEAQFKYTPLSQTEAGQWSEAELRKLSPAEKFDLFNSNYDYPTVYSERAHTGLNRPAWEGICHGWAPASIAFKEPRPVTLKNAEGISVPFGSSDIKALLTYYLGRVEHADNRTHTFFMGGRCDTDLAQYPDHAHDLDCRDTNAGSFHLILANFIGIQKRAFIFDQSRGLEVWNQPAYGYLSAVVNSQGASANAAPGTVLEVDVVTRVFFTHEVSPNWNPLNGTPDFLSNNRLYQYRLELDAQNTILGGEWLNAAFEPSAQADRPDFVWIQDAPDFTGRFAKIAEIYKASVATQGGILEQF